jgi:hypothetical protein
VSLSGSRDCCLGTWDRVRYEKLHPATNPSVKASHACGFIIMITDNRSGL